MFKPNALDRVLLQVAPKWALSRIRARAVATIVARHYDAASVGRRTQHWPRSGADANVAAGPALGPLRASSRELIRNNAWARNAKRVINRNVVGWGITPKAVGPMTPELRAAWKRWSGTTQCDAAGRVTFAGLQKLVQGTVFEGGEALVRRRWRRPEDNLAIPLQLQVLEPDFLDTSKTNMRGSAGGEIVYGVEFDVIGRRVAYWLFDRHPGSSSPVTTSKRVPASEILHVYDLERAGQDRGIPWPVAAILSIKDFDEFEDAQLLRQKLAACFAAFVSDPDGSGAPLGEDTSPLVETLEPGLVSYLKPGQEVNFGTPPTVTDDGFSVRTLRKIAAAIGTTYEDLTNDYSQVNFSSARMSRIAHWGNVYDWQWNMLIPQFCDPAWGWAMEAASLAGLVPAGSMPTAEWNPMPMPMTDPDKEAKANVTRIRSGQATLPQVLREQGLDPDVFLEDYAKFNARLDELGIWLDSDVRRVSQAGLTQERVGAGGGSATSSSQGSEGDAADE